MVVCRHCGTANQPGQVACAKCNRGLIDPAMVGKIACVNHANREATASCSRCSSMLCDQCAYILGETFCEGCAPEGAIAHEHDEDYEALPIVDVVDEEVERAVVGARVFAFLIDTVLFLAASALLAALLAMSMGGILYLASYQYLTNMLRPQFWVFWLLLPIGYLTYHTLLVGMSGQTIGKRVAGVIVLDPDGTIVDTNTAFKRASGQLLSMIPAGLGFLWALWDGNHETWHDKLAQTVVFRYQDTT